MRSGATHTTSTSAASTVDPNAEPVFNAATQTLVLSDDMDSYATFADAVAGGWLANNSTSVQDTSSNAAGSNLIVGGQGGSGSALRLEYYGVANSGGQEVHAWGHDLGDALAGKPGHDIYLSYYVRIVPISKNLDTPAPSDIVKVKWLELWMSGGRAQFSTSYTTIQNNIPFSGASGTGTMWGFYGTASGVPTDSAGAVARGWPSSNFDPHPPQAGQTRPAATVGGGLGTDFGGGWAYQGASQWHRLTHRFRTVTTAAGGGSASSRDSLAQMWYDGTLIVAAGASYANVAVPNAQGVSTWAAFDGTPGGNPQKWCTPLDLDDWFANDHVSHFTLGSVSTSGLWQFAIDYDHLSIWRD